MAKPGMQPVTGRKPLTRKISARSITYAVSGAEQPYDVYRFSGTSFVERPNHNPFNTVIPIPPPVTGETAWGSSWGESWGESWGV
jgi:hypothetical protein